MNFAEIMICAVDGRYGFGWMAGQLGKCFNDRLTFDMGGCDYQDIVVRNHRGLISPILRIGRSQA